MSVNVNATPSNKDFIALTEYDDLGRKSREWLPVALATTGGYAAPENIKAAALGAGGYNDEMPYVSYVYEDSPDPEYSNNANRERLCRGAGRQRQKHII